jgi:hypothetical protein
MTARTSTRVVVLSTTAVVGSSRVEVLVVRGAAPSLRAAAKGCEAGEDMVLDLGTASVKAGRVRLLE